MGQLLLGIDVGTHSSKGYWWNRMVSCCDRMPPNMSRTFRNQVGPNRTQIVSDVAGIPQIVSAQTIGTSYGDAFLAGLGASILRKEDLSIWVKPGYVIEPDPARHVQYEPFYEQYLQLYENTRNIIHALNSD